VGNVTAGLNWTHSVFAQTGLDHAQVHVVFSIKSKPVASEHTTRSVITKRSLSERRHGHKAARASKQWKTADMLDPLSRSHRIDEARTAEKSEKTSPGVVEKQCPIFVLVVDGFAHPGRR